MLFLASGRCRPAAERLPSTMLYQMRAQATLKLLV